MANLRLILVVAAFVCECFGTFGVPAGRVNLIAAGLACYFASLLFG